MRAAEELRYLVLAAQREGNRQLSAALKPLGITPSQAEVIQLLADHSQLSISELGKLLVCESGTNPSRLVDRLVAGGYLQRATDPADRRSVILALTGQGGELAGTIKQIENALYHAIDQRSAGLDISATLHCLRALVDGEPSGHALARRKSGSL